MNVKTAKKIGFFSALSICFSSVVGIGIFLKNSSIGKNVDGNGLSWLITWIFAGFTALLLAYNFGKISQIESEKGLTGLSSWTDEITKKNNKWFKIITNTNYGMFYGPILTLCISFFTAEFLIDFFKQINPYFQPRLWVYLVFSFLLLSFFILNNYFSPKFSGYVSLITSILKFIPLFIAILIGIIFMNTHNLSSTVNGFNVSISYDKAFQGIMLSMPSVLFAFDAFIGVGSWSRDIKGGEKSVSKVIVIAMVSVTILYCLICVASILHYNKETGTTIVNVLIDSFPPSASKGITIFVSFFIFISAFGTANSICGTSMNEFKNIVIDEKIMFSSFFNRKFGIEKGSLFFTLFIFFIWICLIFIPSIIINNDALIDGMSNMAVLFLFLIYAYLIILYWKNIYLSNKSENNKKKKIYALNVWITFIFMFLIVILNIYFVFYNGIIKSNDFANWGLLLSDGKYFTKINNLVVLICYIVFIIIFVSFPFINKIIVDWRKK